MTYAIELLQRELEICKRRQAENEWIAKRHPNRHVDLKYYTDLNKQLEAAIKKLKEK